MKLVALKSQNDYTVLCILLSCYPQKTGNISWGHSTGFLVEMMAASLPRWTWYTRHFANKTIGSLAKCWLFSQAVFMLSKVLSYYERHNAYCCLTSSWFLEPWLPSSVLLTLLPVFSSAGAGIWCTQLLQERTTVVNIQSQCAKIRKSCLIAQGWWILLPGLWILFLTCLSGKGSF